MEIRLLGPVEVADDEGALVAITAPTQRAVLARLALEAGRVVSVDRLVDAVWEEEAPAGARGTLRYHISKLRDVLEPATRQGRAILVARAGGYLLDVPPEDVDLGRFEILVSRGRSMLGGSPAAAAELLRTALGMVRGEPLGEFTYREFAAATVRRIEETRLGALEDRIAADLELGGHSEVVAELRSLVVEHPLRERLWGQLMVALVRSGRQAEALRAFQDARRTLGTELGIEPTEELRALEEQVLMQDPALLATASPTGPPPLPVRFSSFVGRRAEISEVSALVSEHRLVTIVGPPGAGKTRLAMETAARLPADWVWFADVTQRNEPRRVSDAVASALGLTEPGRVDDRRDLAHRVVDHLRRKTGLLVVDNCEDVLAEAGREIHRLLTTAPGLSVLATSRELLGVEGERAWPIPTLGSGEDAVTLFAERARAVDPEFRIDEATRDTVERICARLDGLPLGIELAAAHTVALAVADIERRLDERLLDARGGVLRSAIEMSYDALDDDARRLIRRLAICSGSFDLRLVEAIGAPLEDPVGALERLVRHSLIGTERSAGPTRYVMLETIRWFALEGLRASGEEPDARRGHAAEMVERAERWFRDWSTVDPWPTDPKEDMGNVRAALAWLGDHEPREFRRLAAALGPVWRHLWLSDEGFEVVQRALATGGDDVVRARLLLAAALTARGAERAHSALEHSEEILSGLESAGDRPAAAQALVLFGTLGEFFWVEGFHAARRRAVEMARRLGEPRLLAFCLENLAWSMLQAGDPGAVEPWRESEGIYLGLGDDLSWAGSAAPRISAQLLFGLTDGTDPADELARVRDVVAGTGTSLVTAQIENELRIVHERLGRLPSAIEHGRRALGMFEELGDEPWRALCLTDLGDLYRQTGELAAAAECLVDAADYFGSTGRPGSSIWVTETIVQLLADAKDHRAAAELAGAAERLREVNHAPRPVWDAVTYDPALDSLRAALGDRGFEAASARGAGLSIGETLALATGRVRRLLR